MSNTLVSDDAIVKKPTPGLGTFSEISLQKNGQNENFNDRKQQKFCPSHLMIYHSQNLVFPGSCLRRSRKNMHGMAWVAKDWFPLSFHDCWGGVHVSGTHGNMSILIQKEDTNKSQQIPTLQRHWHSIEQNQPNPNGPNFIQLVQSKKKHVWKRGF